ncbi:uncharacterized protein LODBEIA_P05220 [Lodderomyces beijingensis]|uniref:DUF1746 domain-containing protein n=1 Tax=Lodderomyces beijingensis TaxID=1775926 RepID=A0ABP0ZDQ2_9ASCO
MNHPQQFDLEKELREFNTQRCPTIEQTISNNRSVLYKRKKFFLQNLRESIQVVEISLIIILYLRDVSFLRLLLRAAVHLAVTNINPPVPHLQLSPEHKESMIKLSLRGVIYGNLFCMILHLIFGAYSSNSGNGDGNGDSMHGGMTVQFIGERYPYSRLELIALDLCIFATQLIYHYLIGVVNDSKVLEAKSANEAMESECIEMVESPGSIEGHAGRAPIEEDGYNGNVFLLTIDLLGGMKKVMDYNINFEGYTSSRAQV